MQQNFKTACQAATMVKIARWTVVRKGSQVHSWQAFRKHHESDIIFFFSLAELTEFLIDVYIVR